MNQTRINTQDKIFVAGGRGLVGSAVIEVLRNRGYNNILKPTRAQLDLSDNQQVKEFFKAHSPDVVIVAAAKVGGILANNLYRADFIAENLAIQNNVIWNAHLANARRLVFLGSSCIYPKLCPQPIKEEYLLTGPLEETNKPYAVAKIAGLEMVESIRRQYKRDWFSVMPTNLFGPNDNYHPENSHVIPALIRRFVEAVQKGEDKVTVWGTGRPKREFLYSLDCANMIVRLLEIEDFQKVLDSHFKGAASHINLGTGQDLSIAELAQKVATAAEFQGEIVFDTSKPDGTPRKVLDVSLLHKLGLGETTGFEVALVKTVGGFLNLERGSI